ncbi:MAG: hypothetical protein LCI00_20855 [Chloroflexi bacterium]|nr:hypothetical protein [Chloroflexota bacterium]MCC6892442.1 hypothetical protein [Anaerolineae bacterium]
MQFVYYSEKTVSQCMLALNERLHQKSGKFDGWVEKNGRFSLRVSTTVLKRFSRTTEISGKVEKENGVTVVRGFVSDGADPRSRYIIYGILAVVGGALALGGYLLPGLLAIGAILPLNIPLEGDYLNSQTLTGEIQRTLKAKSTLPAALRKPKAEKKETTRSASSGGKTFR